MIESEQMEESKREIIGQIEQMSAEEIRELRDFVEFLNWKKYRPGEGMISQRDRGALVPSAGGELARRSEVHPPLTQDGWHKALEMIVTERLDRLRASH